MRYILACIAIIFTVPALAENYCRGDSRLFYDGQKMIVSSGECMIKRIEGTPFLIAKFTCPGTGMRGIVIADDNELRLVSRQLVGLPEINGQLIFTRCD